MLLLLGLFIFLSIIFENTEGKFSKGRGEHMSCGEALGHGVEFLQRLPSVPMHPQHLRRQQVREVLTTIQSTVKAHSEVPKPFQSNLCPSSGFVMKPGGFNRGSLWGLVRVPEVKNQNPRCEKQQKLDKALLDPGWDKAQEGHKVTESRVTSASPSTSRVAQISDSELGKTSIA